jgi:hypothetical protein
VGCQFVVGGGCQEWRLAHSLGLLMGRAGDLVGVAAQGRVPGLPHQAFEATERKDRVTMPVTLCQERQWIQQQARQLCHVLVVGVVGRGRGHAHQWLHMRHHVQ